jgi:hypothetical protein
MEMIPVPLETLMAIELVCSIILYGILLLDILKVTHVTKFFSPEFLSRPLQYIFGGIFATGILFSTYLLATGGILRTDSMFADGATGAVASETAEQGVSSVVYTPGSKAISDTGLMTDSQTQKLSTEPLPESYKNSIKLLMVGIPVTSAIAGAFGAVGLIPSVGMTIAGLAFVIVSIAFGLPWLIGYVGVTIVNHIYSFLFSFLDIFIQAAENIRLKFSVARTDGANRQVPPAEPQQPDHNANQSGQHTSGSQTNAHTADSSQGEGARSASGRTGTNHMYDETDPNWNPLF